MEVAQERRQQTGAVNILRRNADGAGEVPRVRCRSIGELLRFALDTSGHRHQLLTGRGQHIACLTLVEERKADRFLKSGYPARHRGLADAQCAARRQRAALTGDGEEITKVIPVEHYGAFLSRGRSRTFCNFAE